MDQDEFIICNESRRGEISNRGLSMKRLTSVIGRTRELVDAVLALIFWDGGWKNPRRDRRNGL
jgi:hypothetical protein